MWVPSATFHAHPLRCGSNEGQLEYQMFGDNMQDEIGKEVKKLIDIAYKNAQEILKQNIETLHAIATELMTKEKINEQQFKKFFN